MRKLINGQYVRVDGGGAMPVDPPVKFDEGFEGMTKAELVAWLHQHGERGARKGHRKANLVAAAQDIVKNA